MKYYILTAIIACSLFSCQREQAHIPPQQMGKMLLDIQLAEVYSTLSKNDSLHRNIKDPDSLALYYKEVLNHYKVTPDEFDQSLNWYKAHPEELDTIYEKMLPQLSAYQARYQQKI